MGRQGDLGQTLCCCQQVNTSGEESKYGIEPDQAGALARHVREGCAHLRLAGLMTIGQPDYSSRPENFQVGCGGLRFRGCRALG